MRLLSGQSGTSFSLSEITSALETHHPAVFYVAHGESSTGVVQDLEGVGEVCRR